MPHLSTAALIEQNDEWAVGRRYGACGRWAPQKRTLNSHQAFKRSFALNLLRANGVAHVSEVLYINTLRLDWLLAYKVG